ncbi:hypothetical protein WJM97_13920 [Okeanomitos corallinicola TIOX110]|uniref:ApeA N-terminal domain-containing protein n=1 Tax=Okeanomitos corallinicola TIOX110 TaxID=3133117 RepID=A0ABZ2UNX3_9CYAN
MIFLDDEDNLIAQQQDIELFNNIGYLDDFEGRLTVWLTINPTPRIRWEFEVARGDYRFIEKPKRLVSWEDTSPSLVVFAPKAHSSVGCRSQMSGYAEKVIYGNIDTLAHYFNFYLPNTDFIRQATGGNFQDFINNFNQPLKANLGNGWTVELFTNEHALKWLDPRQVNQGSMITLKIQLFDTDKDNIDKIQNLRVKSILDASKIFYELCLMLSYINGGYVQPIYLTANKAGLNERHQRSSLAISQLISPIEEVGKSFLRNYGIEDLLNFINCFSNFQKMRQLPHWQEKWILILEWYFQAIPRISERRRNPLLPVVVNALGTLLENLARIILVDDELDQVKRDIKEKQFERDKKYLKKIKDLGLEKYGFNLENEWKEDGLARYRLRLLLKRIGINNEEDNIKNFVRIRNNATHAKNDDLNLDIMKQHEVVWTATQWVDEIILWRLGYNGQYKQRSLKTDKPINPRYDLSLRDCDW